MHRSCPAVGVTAVRGEGPGGSVGGQQGRTTPAGDLDGDGHGDVLARDKAGTLWRCNGLGNGLLKERVKVFANWGTGYNVIVGPGDITGDGKADLVSRDGSGNVWRNDGDGKGSFGPRVKIAGGWQGYKGLF